MLKIRPVGLRVVNGKWSCDYTDQGMTARQQIEGTEAHAHPSRTIRAYTAAINEYIFSTQYAVSSDHSAVPKIAVPLQYILFTVPFLAKLKVGLGAWWASWPARGTPGTPCCSGS